MDQTFTTRLLAQFTKITGLTAKTSRQNVVIPMEDIKTFVLKHVLPPEEASDSASVSKPSKPLVVKRSASSRKNQPFEYVAAANKILAAARATELDGVKMPSLTLVTGYGKETTTKMVAKLVEEGKLGKTGAGPGTRYFIPKPFKKINTREEVQTEAPVSDTEPTPIVANPAQTATEALAARVLAIVGEGGIVGYERHQIQELLGRPPQAGGVVMTAIRKLIQEKQLAVYRTKTGFFYRLEKLTDSQIRKNIALLLDPVTGSDAKEIAEMVGLPINRISVVLQRMPQLSCARSGNLLLWKRDCSKHM